MQPLPFTCSRCNAILPGGVTQCPNCGVAFPTPVPYSAGAYSQPPAGTYGQPPAGAYVPVPVAGNKSNVPVVAIVLGVCAVGCLPMIAIVAAILFPVFAKARQEARYAASTSNLRLIGLAVNQYVEANGKYPATDSMTDFQSSLSKYLTVKNGGGEDIYSEPGAGSYVLNPAVSNEPLSSISDPANTVIAKEPTPRSDGGVETLYADGTVLEANSNGGQSSTNDNGDNSTGTSANGDNSTDTN